jgi:hypothetical protein
MAEYRLYYISDDNKITNEENLEFATDEEAIASVDGLKTGRAMELWKGDKRIKVFPLILKEGR